MSTATESISTDNKRTRELLSQVSVSSLLGPSPPPLIYVDEKATVANAMNILARNRLLSCPVLRSETEAAAASGLAPGHVMGDYLGVVDAVSLVRNFIQDLQKKGSAAWANATELLASPADQRAALTALGAQYESKPVTDVIAKDLSLTTQTAIQSMSVLDLIQRHLLSQKGTEFHAHRAFIASRAYGRVSTVVSQSDIIRHLSRFPELLAGMAGASVRDLGLVRGGVVTVHSETPTLSAYHFMVSKNVSAVAVIGPDRKILTALSSSDFRGMTVERFGDLLLPVVDFLRLVPPSPYFGDLSSSGSSLRDLKAPVLCAPTDTLESVVKKMAEKRVHRVFVCDADCHPQGVVSLTDLLILLTREPELGL